MRRMWMQMEAEFVSLALETNLVIAGPGQLYVAEVSNA